MPSQVCLALLELNGVGFSVEECERQKHVMQAKLTALESQAYNLAGHNFSLTSIDDIAQVRQIFYIPAGVFKQIPNHSLSTAKQLTICNLTLSNMHPGL